MIRMSRKRLLKSSFGFLWAATLTKDDRIHAGWKWDGTGTVPGL
jgi:hypothetical protein